MTRLQPPQMAGSSTALRGGGATSDKGHTRDLKQNVPGCRAPILPNPMGRTGLVVWARVFDLCLSASAHPPPLLFPLLHLPASFQPGPGRPLKHGCLRLGLFGELTALPAPCPPRGQEAAVAESVPAGPARPPGHNKLRGHSSCSLHYQAHTWKD